MGIFNFLKKRKPNQEISSSENSQPQNQSKDELQKEKDITIWRFEECIKALIALSKEPEAQRRFVGYGDVNFELVDEFESNYKGYQSAFAEQGLIAPDKIPQLDNILYFFEHHSKENGVEFWDDSSIENSSIWAELRGIAKAVLKELDMSDWDISVDRTVEGSHENGENSIFVERTFVHLIKN
ncbi:MAG: hypothetical protein ACFHU9_15265 [Fluviicola sp.]